MKIIMIIIPLTSFTNRFDKTNGAFNNQNGVFTCRTQGIYRLSVIVTIKTFNLDSPPGRVWLERIKINDLEIY